MKVSWALLRRPCVSLCVPWRLNWSPGSLSHRPASVSCLSVCPPPASLAPTWPSGPDPTSSSSVHPTQLLHELLTHPLEIPEFPPPESSPPRKWDCHPTSCHRCCLITAVSDSWRAHGLWSTRLLHPWDFPGKKIGVGYHFLLQGISPTQGSNPHLLFWQADSSLLSHPRSLSHWLS